MVKITGDKAYSGMLRAVVATELKKTVGTAVFDAADLIHTEAHLSIMKDAVTGKFHVPSRPGEPPKNDTGDLVRGLHHVRTGIFSAEVVSDAGHAVVLEFGTSKMAARPYMAPAAEKKGPEAVEKVKQAIEAAFAKAKGASR